MIESLKNNRPSTKQKLAFVAVGGIASLALLSAADTDKQMETLNSEARNLSTQWALALSSEQYEQLSSAAVEVLVHEDFPFITNRRLLDLPMTDKLREDRNQFIDNFSPNLLQSMIDLYKRSAFNTVMGFGGLGGSVVLLLSTIVHRERQWRNAKRSLA